MLLKKSVLGGLTALVLVGALAVSCATPTEEKKETVTPAKTKIALGDWIIDKGSGNNVSAANLSVATDTDGSLKATWQTTAAWGIVELYAPLPSVDSTGYDQIKFEFKTPVTVDPLVILRGTNSTDGRLQSWKYEGYVDASTTPGYSTITVSLGSTGTNPLTDPHWNGASVNNVDANARAFLNSSLNSGKEIHINIVSNNGGGTADPSVNTSYIANIKNLRFVDSTATKSDLVIW